MSSLPAVSVDDGECRRVPSTQGFHGSEVPGRDCRYPLVPPYPLEDPLEAPRRPAPRVGGAIGDWVGGVPAGRPRSPGASI